MRKYIFPVLLGFVGCAILVSLGIWQMQRLQWKTTILNEIDARITAAPIDIPDNPDPQTDKYLPVTVSGQVIGAPIYVLVTPEGLGPGYRYIQAFDTGDRRILVDMGWVPLEALNKPDQHVQYLKIIGNLHWPEEVDGWTPPPDAIGIWFARDVPAMAQALDTDPIMVVARKFEMLRLATPLNYQPFLPLPLDTSVVKNDHLNYAVTWFSLALVWALMTGFLIFRIRQKDA